MENSNIYKNRKLLCKLWLLCDKVYNQRFFLSEYTDLLLAGNKNSLFDEYLSSAFFFFFNQPAHVKKSSHNFCKTLYVYFNKTLNT